MENLLLQIVKDSSSGKFATIRSYSQEAYDFLESQQGNVRAPPYELRQKCLNALQYSLESHNSKLISHAINGFQKLLRDDRFHSSFECENENQWLPAQILQAVSSVTVQTDDIQVDVLKILLNMACTNWWSMNSKMILQILQLCLDVYTDGVSAVRTAAQATASQTLRSFCNYLEEESKAQKNNPFQPNYTDTGVSNESVFDDVIPILNFFCAKLSEYQRHPQSKLGNPNLLLLESMLTLISCLPAEVRECSLFLNFLWQKFCPTLIAFLGLPCSNKNIVSSQRTGGTDNTEIGRGSGCSATAPTYTGAEAKMVYSIAVCLVDLVGIVGSLRPMLESLFHRMLLYPPAQHRLEVLKAIKEILQSPQQLLHFAGPILIEDRKNPQSSDLSLLTLAMDSIVECSQCSDTIVCYASIKCIVALLRALSLLCQGEGLSPKQIEIINNLYADLPSCDYSGPITYRTRENYEQNITNKSYCASEIINDSVNQSFIENAGKPSLCKQANSLELSDNEKDRDEILSNPPAEDDIGYQGDQEDADAEGDYSFDATKKLAKCSLTDNRKISNSGEDVTAENHIENELADCKNDRNFYDTDSSGITEGPEEGFDTGNEEDLDEMLEETVQKMAEEEAARREKVPKTLLGEETGKSEREQIERLCEAKDEFAQLERHNAQHFVGALSKLLPSLLHIRSSIEADEAIQVFASQYCEGIYGHQSIDSGQNSSSESLAQIIIINADGVYLATYSALLLNLKLIKSDYYSSKSSSKISVSEEQFVDQVHGSGVLVYLSAIWLSELYQQVLQTSILEQAGYKPNATENSSIINLLTGMGEDHSTSHLFLSDLDGLENEKPGMKLLSDYRRLEKAAANAEKSPSIDAGMKFSRRVLTGCWDSVLEVLSVLLNGTNACGISSSIGLVLGMEGAKEEHRKARDAIAESLEGLQKAARLSNILGLQARCGSVFAHLANASCSSQESKDGSSQKKRLRAAVLSGKSKQIRLHVSQVLSLDVLLSSGLELGSHSPECWRHVFRCCIFVADLEHTYFSHLGENSPTSLTKLQKLHGKDKTLKDDNLSDSELSTYQITISEPIAPQIHLIDLIQQSNNDSSSNGIINSNEMEKVICGLTHLIDRLFDDAARKLNLQALISFLTELCAASQAQLFNHLTKKIPISTPLKSCSGQQSGLLLLYRLGDVMLKCVRSGRPLVHIMKAWSIVGPHFMEASCHKERTISKKAIASIHDVVTALLAAQSELPHFHFNEALFKPFENLLCLELCDMDVQDQIVSSICEFVEGSTTEIRSGWRPLFGALRAVRPPSTGQVPESSTGHMRVVLDVFEAFLSTDNVLVFSNAAVDCILCLLKHIRGPTVETREHESNTELPEPSETSLDLCLASLKYIYRCAAILASMYGMPACPIFHAAHRIKLNTSPQFVDPSIPNMEIIPMSPDFEDLSVPPSPESLLAQEVLLRSDVVFVTLDTLDQNSGILHVWFLLLDGLASAVSTCQRKYQPYTMESLFAQLRGLIEVPGPDFAVFCVNHLLLPMLQAWLRRTSRIFRGWDNYAPNFKQCCGLATDLVVDFFSKLSDDGKLESVPGVWLMLKQLMLVMIECITQPTESISRLGCACIRHVILSAAAKFNAELWELACLSLHRACTVSLHHLRQLMVAFHADSDNFYGDIGQVKVAARRDCTPIETERLQQLAYQVFLLDSQRCHGYKTSDVKEDDYRSFIFLLYPPNVEQTMNPELYVTRVPFRSLVVGLLSHQILLQTIGTLLLQGTKYVIPSLANILLHSPAVTPSDPGSKLPGTTINKLNPQQHLPGILPYLSSRSLKILLDSLSQSYQASCDFDARPGLKFLVQKVAQAEVAANLYKQAGASWTIHAITLLQLSLQADTFSLESIKSKITTETHFDDQESTAYPEILKLNCISKLRDCLMSLCEQYVDMILDKDGHHSHADKISDQPIFFLVAHPDDFPELPSLSADLEKIADEKEVIEPVCKQPSADSNDSEVESIAEGTEGNGEAPALNNEEEGSKVYSVATQRDIQSMMQEYKRRKHQHAMPAPLKTKRRNPFLERSKPSEPVPEEIDAQRRSSIMKDSEAHIKVFSEMLLSVFDLLCQLDDQQFTSLLPVTFPMVRTLVTYARDASLRQTLAEYLTRVAVLYDFIIA